MNVIHNLTDKEIQKLDKLLTLNKDSLDEILTDFLREYLLFGHFPSVKYAEMDLGPVSASLDFYSEPLSCIHPLKRSAVSAILESDIPSTIDKIIIFGSAVTLRCTTQSDLDICIVGSFKLKTPSDKEWLKTLRKSIGPKDLKIYTAEQLAQNAGVQKDINKKGVVIYAKKDNR